MTLGRLLILLLGIGLLIGVILWPSSPEPEVSPKTPENVPALDQPTAAPVFVDITEKAGLDFVHRAGELEAFYFPAIMGGGCALLDINNDGLLDAYLINGNEQVGQPTETKTPTARNQLFQQVEPGRFVNVTEKSGLGDTGYGLGVAVGDINNDGFSDIYVTNVGADKLYLNRGDGTFRDVTESAGIENRHWAASASFVDFDRDGWLDLYVTNYVDYFPERTCPDSSGHLDFCGPQTFFSVSDKLFRNVTGDPTESTKSGTVRFRDVSVSSGIAAQAGAGLGVVCVDVNQDRWPDIYVA
ncbi:MAG: VCBS repeat-containing protein, partial [Planctomycetaceae bacterium]|nr:VCBS repeat-containing protein [Planctomycetaceae bacterium]